MQVTAAGRASIVGVAREHRGDIDGLRAVAIVLVVAFHTGLSRVGGGFVGVDVFFVISGYLISSLLLAETGRTGTVDLLAFWGKRIRRLVPALALMLVGVFALAILVLNPLEWTAVAAEGRAAALYVSNIYFAENATDYFAAGIGTSLFLHTWSLGVEEQFYVVWPLFFAGACLLVRPRAARRTVIVAAFAVVLVASFGLSLWLTQRGSPWAFFSLPTRAWEFAVAGLLAACPVPEALRRRGVATVAAAVGLALVVAAALLYTDTTPYPGYRALLPVVGTVLVILAGAGGRDGERNPVSAALATRPTQWIGRVSYSWYLWHWPLILLAVAWLDEDDLVVTGGAALVSLAIAAFTFRVVENPIRFAPALTTSKPRTYALGAGITVSVLLATVGVVQYADAEIGGDGLYAELDEVRAVRRAFNCPREVVSDGGIDYCEAGPGDAALTVVLAGDSHTRHWTPAFIEAAEEAGFRLAIRWRGACPSTNIPTVQPGRGTNAELVEACVEFQRDTDALIAELGPDVVVLANSTGYKVDADRPLLDADARPRFWTERFRERIVGLQDQGIAVAVIADTPRLPFDAVECMAEAGATDPCDVSYEESKSPDGFELAEAEAGAVEQLGDVATLDVNDELCPDGVCRMRIGGTLVYTDREHMNDAFVVRFVPDVIDLVDRAIAIDARED